MPLEMLTREFFDTLIIVVIVIGGALAAVRLYRDFTRPLTPEQDSSMFETRPGSPSSPPRADTLEEDETF